MLANFDYNIINNECDFNIRIINSSGFQIDSFLIQIFIRCNSLSYNRRIFNNTIQNENNNLGGPIFTPFFTNSTDTSNENYSMQQNNIFGISTEPVQYFDPNTMKDLHWKFSLSHFDSYSIMTKVIFPNMRIESDRNLNLFPPIEKLDNNNNNSSVPSKELSSKLQMDDDEDNDNDGDNNMNKDDINHENIKSSSIKLESIEMNFIPYHIGIIHQLIPYGNHVINSNFDNNNDMMGIPYFIYLSLWQRLQKCSISIPLDIDNSFLNSITEEFTFTTTTTTTTTTGMNSECIKSLPTLKSKISTKILNLIDNSVKCDMSHPCNGKFHPMSRLGILSRVDCCCDCDIHTKSSFYNDFIRLDKNINMMDTSTTDNNNNTSCNDDDDDLCVLIWCFQTAQNYEIIIKLCIQSELVVIENKTSKVLLKSWVEIRASNDSILISTLSDVFNLLNELTGRTIVANQKNI